MNKFVRVPLLFSRGVQGGFCEFCRCTHPGNDWDGLERAAVFKSGGVFRRTRSKTLVTAYIRPFEHLDKEDRVTGKEIYDELNDYLKTQPVPAWAKAELEEASDLASPTAATPWR